jgi:hypothetical protein
VLKSTIAINAAEWTLSFHSLKVESDLKVKLTVFETVWHSSLCFSCYFENETVYNISPSWNCCAFRSYGRYVIQKPFWRSFQELEVKSDLKVKLTVFERYRGQFAVLLVLFWEWNSWSYQSFLELLCFKNFVGTGGTFSQVLPFLLTLMQKIIWCVY